MNGMPMHETVLLSVTSPVPLEKHPPSPCHLLLAPVRREEVPIDPACRTFFATFIVVRRPPPLAKPVRSPHPPTPPVPNNVPQYDFRKAKQNEFGTEGKKKEEKKFVYTISTWVVVEKINLRAVVSRGACPGNHLIVTVTSHGAALQPATIERSLKKFRNASK